MLSPLLKAEPNPLPYFPSFDAWLFMKQQIDDILPSFEHAQWLEEQKPNIAKLAAPPPGWMPRPASQDNSYDPEEDGA